MIMDFIVVFNWMLCVGYIGQVNKEVGGQGVYVIGENIVCVVVVVGVKDMYIVDEDCYFWCRKV